jgi:hypothetical protein
LRSGEPDYRHPTPRQATLNRYAKIHQRKGEERGPVTLVLILNLFQKNGEYIHLLNESIEYRRLLLALQLRGHKVHDMGYIQKMPDNLIINLFLLFRRLIRFLKSRS